ncbi:MAG: hypothetical protein J5589_02350 [Firmicutes bacterium]|nr:hypothetical protein [Bacillota bacterium]
MIKRIGLLLLGVFLVLCGLGMIEMAFTDPDFETASVIFAVICGVLFVGGGIALTILQWQELFPKKKKGAKQGEYLKALKSDINPNFIKVTEDHNETEHLIRVFRKDYSDFFGERRSIENAGIQNDVTQMYWHTLFLQKKRMDRKGILHGLESERLHYGSLESVRQTGFFDGKYQVRDVSETIEAKQTFYDKRTGKPVFKRKSLQTAWYQLVNAASSGPNQIICPNCGQISTRENLLDGCDWCGTKFTVEDLGTRVSDFCFRQDYEAEYARYTDIRENYGRYVAMAVGIPIFLLCLVMAIKYVEVSSPYVLSVAGILFAAAFPTAAVVLLAEIAFFLWIFPLLQARASITYYSKKKLSAMKAAQIKDSAAEKRVRAFDPLFSLSGFYAGVQNILSVIHFADTPQEAAAFADSPQAEGQIGACLGYYQNLIDVRTEEISLVNYQAGPLLQEALVNASLELVHENTGSVKRSRENVQLYLVKSSACKTQAVCAPSFMRCKGCGAPMSLMDGKRCHYCGRERNLSESDWAVRGYTIYK